MQLTVIKNKLLEPISF